MIDRIDFFFFFIIGAVLLLSALGLWSAAIMPGIERWSRRFFLCYFSVLVACCFFGFFDVTFQYYPAPRAVMYFVLIMETLFLSLSLVMLTIYLLHCCEERMCRNRLFYAVIGLWVLFLILLASVPFTGVFSYVDSEGNYYRRDWYTLLILPVVAITLLDLAGTIRRRKRLSHKSFLSLLVALLSMTVVLVIQLFIDVFPLLDISIVLSALSMYGLILSDQKERDLRNQREIAQQQLEIANQQLEITWQQLEIANQRANIMVLQMRPHFIYNTMTSIYCLCNQDPKLARQVILDFTTYLRKNFTAIESTEPIPFSSELEHTRAYLAVEQVQYRDSLFVDYDTMHVRFRIPPLTLQPIVENAVKHGRDPCAGPFHISIRTKKTDSGSEIIVADDGRGFGFADDGCGLDFADDGSPHIALKNIRQRLEIMCGGHLTITSGDGPGTVVTVTIPDANTK